MIFSTKLLRLAGILSYAASSSSSVNLFAAADDTDDGDVDLCLEKNTFAASVDEGDCITDWSANTWYEYPDDFQGVENEVTIYTCPQSNQRIIISNGIPDHRTQAARGAAPCEYRRAVTMPLNPVKQSTKRELPTRGTIAFALNGVPAYGPMESGSANAVEPDDDTLQGAQYWYGHAAGNTWHIHHPYLGNEDATSDDLLGYAMDGFPIYGPVDDDDLDTLDECNGVEVDGSYQYHVRSAAQVDIADSDLPYCVEQGVLPEVNWNYILGCYHGDIDDSDVVDASTFTLPDDCIVEGSPTAEPTTSPPTVSPAPSKQKQNVNFIIMQPDDMEFYDDWGPPPNDPDCNKNCDMPFPEDGLPYITSLKEGGLWMKQAYAASPMCGTSRYSTMTGRLPSRAVYSREKAENQGYDVADVTIPNTKMADDDEYCEENLASILQENGWKTGMVGKWHLHDFDDYTYERAVTEIEGCGFDFVDGLYTENLFSIDTDNVFSHNMEWVTSAAIEFIDSVGDDENFLLYFNPTVPHNSGNVTAALLEEEYNCLTTPNGLLDEEPMIKGMTEEYGNCADYRQTVYERGTDEKERGATWVDDSVNALLQALDDKGVLENTFFLYQNDHGQNGKSSLWETGIRTPQFIYYPDAFGTDGIEFESAVSTIDIAPTILDYAGVEIPENMDGASWKSAVEDEDYADASDDYRCLYFEADQDRAVRCGCWKWLEIYSEEYTTYSNGDSKGYDVQLGDNLYNLCGPGGNYKTGTEDFQEIEEVSSDYSSVAEAMDDVMQCFLDKTTYTATDDYTSCQLSTFPPSPTSPTGAPTDLCEEDGQDLWLKGTKSGGSASTKKCTWLSSQDDETIEEYCTSDIDYPVDGYYPAYITCPKTCSTCEGYPTSEPGTSSPTDSPTSSGCSEVSTDLFLRRIKSSGEAVTKTCNWLSNQDASDISELCETVLDTTDGYDYAGIVCQNTCDTCSDTTPSPTTSGTTVAPTPAESTCSEDEDALFLKKIKSNGSAQTKTCSWLSSQDESDIDSYCDTELEETEGYAYAGLVCQVTCDSCGLTSSPTTSPTEAGTTASPTPGESTCAEDEDALFLKKIKSNGSAQTKTCSWLAKQDDLSDYCTTVLETTDGYDYAALVCPVTCDSCGLTSTPTSSPTEAGTTASPTPGETTCAEDEDALFLKKIKTNGSAQTKTCSWLAKQDDLSDYCTTVLETTDGYDYAGLVCQSTCDTCDLTSSPTSSPTEAGTTASPTPGESTCTEVSTDLFLKKIKVDGSAQTKTCSWLTSQDDADISSYCSTFLATTDGYEYAGAVCRVTCDTCGTTSTPTSSPTQGCTLSEVSSDDFLRRVKTDGSAVTKTCNWLSSQSDEDVEELCTTELDAVDGYEPAYVTCPVSCGLCD